MADFTQSQLDAALAAYANGTRVVQFEGRRVEYRSLDELSNMIDRMKAQLAPTTVKSRTAYATFSKG